MPTTTSTTMPTTTSTTIHMNTPTTTHHGYAYNFYGGLYMLKSVTRTWGALVIHPKWVPPTRWVSLIGRVPPIKWAPSTKQVSPTSGAQPTGWFHLLDKHNSPWKGIDLVSKVQRTTH
jgi:hypothetical protein